LISAIQGSGASSPLVGQLVTVEGLVVADMQVPPPDEWFLHPVLAVKWMVIH
jgi:hypothetical protein